MGFSCTLVPNVYRKIVIQHFVKVDSVLRKKTKPGVFLDRIYPKVIVNLFIYIHKYFEYHQCVKIKLLK